MGGRNGTASRRGWILMAEYLIQDTTLTSIADAIRSKTGTSALIAPQNMASEIGNIPSGSSIPSNVRIAQYTAEQTTNSAIFVSLGDPFTKLNMAMFCVDSEEWETAPTGLTGYKVCGWKIETSYRATNGAQGFSTNGNKDFWTSASYININPSQGTATLTGGVVQGRTYTIIAIVDCDV